MAVGADPAERLGGRAQRDEERDPQFRNQRISPGSPGDPSGHPVGMAQSLCLRRLSGRRRQEVDELVELGSRGSRIHNR